MPTQLDREIDLAWERVAKIYNCALPERKMPELLKLSERDASRQTRRSLQPWLRIVEEQIYWLATFYIAWLTQKGHSEACSPSDRAPFELLGAITTYAVAVRRLVLSGLDFPARAVLRPLVEAAFTALILLPDAAMRKEYTDVEDDEQARRFWRKRMTRRERARRLEQIETACNLDASTREELAEFRNDLESWLSQFIHPGYGVALLTTRASFPQDPSTLHAALFGCCNVTSQATLGKMFRTLWYFSLMFYALVTTGHMGSVVFKPDLSTDLGIQADLGFDVSRTLAELYWELDDGLGLEDCPPEP